MKKIWKYKKTLLLIPGTILPYFLGLVTFSGIFQHYDDYFTVEKREKAIEVTFLLKRPQKWIPLIQVSSKAIWPIVISEDWAFYEHSGLDFNQLGKVLENAVKSGRVKRGASTITQQVVKNLYLSHERSFFRKFNEMILAFSLELLVDKKWILEQYLNLAEFGPSLFGIKEAAWHYFQKSPSELTYREGAFLAMLLPSPTRYGESFRKSELTEFAQEQIESILTKLVQARIISEEEKQTELMDTFNWEALPDEDFFFP